MAGIAHAGCGQRADHFPHLDLAYCADCGWQRRMDAAEFQAVEQEQHQPLSERKP